MHFNDIGQRVFDSDDEAAAYARGELICDARGNLVKANHVNGEKRGDGLVQHKVQMESGWTSRPAFEYSLQPGRTKRDGWMAPFSHEPLKQTRIANSNAAAEHIRNGGQLNYVTSLNDD